MGVAIAVARSEVRPPAGGEGGAEVPQAESANAAETARRVRCKGRLFSLRYPPICDMDLAGLMKPGLLMR